MEPNCAICDGPAYMQCPCEHQSLILAVEQAEERILPPLWDEIRYWVTSQAKAEIHRDFQARSSLRRAQHSKYLYHNAGRFSNEMLDRVNSELRRGVDEDWRAAVQRYPEVLDFYYSQVGWTIRGDMPTEEIRDQPPRAGEVPVMPPPPGERTMYPSMSPPGSSPQRASYEPSGAFRDPRNTYSGPSSAYTSSAVSSGAPYHSGGIPHMTVYPPHHHLPAPHYQYPGFTYIRPPPHHIP